MQCIVNAINRNTDVKIVCLFVLLLYVPVNSYGHGGQSVDQTTLLPAQT